MSLRELKRLKTHGDQFNDQYYELKPVETTVDGENTQMYRGDHALMAIREAVGAVSADEKKGLVLKRKTPAKKAQTQRAKRVKRSRTEVTEPDKKLTAAQQDQVKAFIAGLLPSSTATTTT